MAFGELFFTSWACVLTWFGHSKTLMILIYICYKICFVHIFSQCMNFLYFYFRSLLFPYYTIFSLSHFLTPKPRCFLSYPQPLLSLVVFIYIYTYIITTCSICVMFSGLTPWYCIGNCFAPPWERLFLLLSASLVACSCLFVLRPLELPTIYDILSVDVLVQLMCRQSCWWDFKDVGGARQGVEREVGGGQSNSKSTIHLSLYKKYIIKL